MKIRLLAVFSFLLLLCACAERVQFDQGRLISDLSEGRNLPLTSYTDFEWDRVFIFPPYTPKSVIQKESGVAVDSAIEYSDSMSLLVFKNEGVGVANIEISRTTIDFSSVYSKVGYKKESAVFTRLGNGSVSVRVVGPRP